MARFDAEEVAHEEVHAPAAGVRGFGSAMVGAGHDEQVKVLVGPDQGVGHLEG
ncbi:MAG: hypothetical protein M5U12_02130 [Verrucomicrobia bacterium]|nr:hypothetical protein [Verrucomicrobiota bacterium]